MELLHLPILPYQEGLLLLFSREQCSKVLKGALLLFLRIIMIKKYAKGTQRERKMFQRNKKCSNKISDKHEVHKGLKALRIQSAIFFGTLWHRIAVPCVA